MSGAASDVQFRDMAMQFYLRTRHCLEQAETDSEKDAFLSLEAAQALILVARFEFMRGHPERGLLTMSRLMRMLTLMGYNRLDQSAPILKPSSSPPDISPDTKLHGKRRAYLLAYLLNAHASSSAVGLGSAADAEMVWNHSTSADVALTLVAQNSISTVSTPSSLSRPSDQESINLPLVIPTLQHTTDYDGPVSLLVRAMQLVTSADRHHAFTAANVSGTGAIGYNYCCVHEQIDVAINTLLSEIPPDLIKKSSNNETYVLSLIVTLGARIALYNTAIVETQKAKFLRPVAVESRKLGLSASQAICDLICQSGLLEPNNVRTRILSPKIFQRVIFQIHSKVSMADKKLTWFACSRFKSMHKQVSSFFVHSLQPLKFFSMPSLAATVAAPPRGHWWKSVRPALASIRTLTTAIRYVTFVSH